MGEIHVALLKLIIKDIEDVARTPSSGLGVSQNGAANPSGGHPEIVEGVTSALCTSQKCYLFGIQNFFDSCRTISDALFSLSGLYVGL